MRLTRNRATRTPLARTGLAALALALSVSLAACGESGDSDSSGDDAAKDSSSMAEDDTSMGGDEASDAGAETIGASCDAIPTDGAGSFESMADKDVATAASENPLLKTLVKAVKKADLVDTLNSAEALTVFAPTDDAFAKLPKKDLNAVLADKDLLTKVLSHHVVAGQLGPEDVAGEHETLLKDMVNVTGSGEDFKVGAEKASVLCGNIPTANAKVYVIDTVLMPEM